MKNLNEMLQQAQAMQAKFAELQQGLDQITVEGSAGGGIVTVIVDGKGMLKGVKIDPELLKPEEKDVVEDLLVAAYGHAKARAEAETARKMAQLSQGMGLPPGFKLPF